MIFIGVLGLGGLIVVGLITLKYWERLRRRNDFLKGISNYCKKKSEGK